MSKTQLYIGTSLLDFNGEVNVKRQVNDYRDLEVGSNVTSYPLDIPLTRTNRPLLGFVNDIRSRVEVTEQSRLIVNGMEIIRGKFRMLKVYGNMAKAIIEGNDWLSGIKGTSIKDISWAGGDEHTFTSANIVASWTAAAGAFYRYPLINFSELISADYGVGGSAVYPYEFYPMWNVEDIVTKLLLDSGYTLASGSFFAGTFGRSLYLLSDPKPAADDFITGKNLNVYVNDNTDNQDSASIATTASDTLTVTQVVDIDAETEDEGSDFVPANNEYTVPEDGTYRFKFTTEIYCSFNRSPASWTVLSNNLSLQIRKNSTAIEIVSASGVTAFDSGNAVYSVDTGYIHLEAGDKIEAYVSMSAQGTNDSPGTLTAYLYLMAGTTTSFLENQWSEQNLWPGIGKTISPADYLPDMSGVDLLKGLKEAFNLRFFVDRMNKTIYIETSNDFYNYGSEIIDWTDKIDYTDDIDIEIISSNYNQIQKLKWKPDTTDKAYSNEVSANGVPLMKEITLDSEYVKDGIKDRPNSVFSPTVLGDMPQIGHWADLVPRIFGDAEFVSSSRAYPANRPKAWNPRLLVWNGMVSLTGSGNFNYYEDIEDSSASNYTTFPSASTPDMSDMYDDYWLRDWNRIEKNKIVTCTLKLTPAELMKFNTVLSTSPLTEGFRAAYKLNIEGVDMLFICSEITTDGSRVRGEFIQKM